MDRLSVSELAQASGLSPPTIRRYGAVGVLSPVEVEADTVPDLTRKSLNALRARARVERRTVEGDPVLRYGWPQSRHDLDNAEVLREVEVCLPVDGEPDVTLPGGQIATTDVEGDDVAYPQRLAAYGAVSQWARAHRQWLIEPALEWWHGDRHVTVGWIIEPRSQVEHGVAGE